MVDLPNYSPPEDCQPPARVTIDGSRIPIINDGVNTQVRKDGPVDVVRYSEVHFPLEWNGGYDFSPILEAAQGEGEPLAEIVDVEYRDYVSGEYVLAQRGYLGGIGGGNETANEMRFSVNDPARLLDIPASYSFSGKGDLSEMIKYIANSIEERQPIFDEIPIEYRFDEGVDVDGEQADIDGGASEDRTIPIQEIVEAQAERGGIDLGRLISADDAFQFSRNRDSLADMVTSFIEQLGFYVWFEPNSDGGVSLVVTNEPHNHFDAHSADPSVSGDVDLRKNDALFEVSPINALEVRGKKTTKEVEIDYSDYADAVDGVFDDIDPDSALNEEKGNMYPYAIIQHDSAVERAGGQIMQSYESEMKTESGAIQDGKRELKNRMDSTSRGTMITELAPNLRSFDVLEARPVCGDVAQNVPPLDWEIENVVHATSAKELPTTELQVSPSVVANDLTVVESGYKKP